MTRTTSNDANNTPKEKQRADVVCGYVQVDMVIHATVSYVLPHMRNVCVWVGGC